MAGSVPSWKVVSQHGGRGGKNRGKEHVEGFFNTTELKELGWTDKMIRELLPEPVLAKNPYNASIPIKRWKRADVEAATRTTAYAEAKERAAKRKESARKAAETRGRKTTELAEKLSEWIHVKKRPLATVLRSGYQSYVSQARLREASRSVDYWVIDRYENIPEDVLKRWAVNYVRHYLTRYDSALDRIQGKTGKEKAYFEIKRATLKKIAETYPELSGECDRQIERMYPGETEGGL